MVTNHMYILVSLLLSILFDIKVFARGMEVVTPYFSHGQRQRRAVSFRLILTEWWRMRMRIRTLSEKSARAGHRAVSLHRDCVLVLSHPRGLKLISVQEYGITKGQYRFRTSNVTVKNSYWLMWHRLFFSTNIKIYIF